jgi:hypothetical protein
VRGQPALAKNRIGLVPVALIDWLRPVCPKSFHFRFNFGVFNNFCYFVGRFNIAIASGQLLLVSKGHN